MSVVFTMSFTRAQCAVYVVSMSMSFYVRVVVLVVANGVLCEIFNFYIFVTHCLQSLPALRNTRKRVSPLEITYVNPGLAILHGVLVLLVVIVLWVGWLHCLRMS